MATELELAYLAGLIDGEAWIGIKKSKAYACQSRQTPSYYAQIQVKMVDETAIRFAADTFGGTYYKDDPTALRGRPLYCWRVSDMQAENALRALLPYLRVKKEMAITALALRELQRSGKDHRTKITGYRDFTNQYGTVRKVANRSFSDEYIAECDALWLKCKALNRVGI